MKKNTLGLAHDFLIRHISKGGFCIDATAGRGRDTELLCSLVGETGRVLAFDIQQEAVDSTKARLKEAGFDLRATVVCDSHSHMADYAQDGTVDGIVFNFGYLPGGDHSIFTRPDSSIAAIEQGLALLKREGIMSLCLYYGGATGYEERDALLAYIKTIDSKQFTVLQCDFVNRENDPPIAVFVVKDA